MHCLTEATVVPVPEMCVSSKLMQRKIRLIYSIGMWATDPCRPGHSVCVVAP